ncbi:MAG: calcium/sodium antiporter [Thiohalomonadaceae bacterium]
MLWSSILAVLGGVFLLSWGADRFVTGAAATARNLGVSPLIIGLTIVGFGTSAPEMLVSAMAAWAGNPGIAIGNALGSNIANIGLVLGMTALLSPLTIRSQTLQREFPLLFAIMALVVILLLDGELSRLDGVIMLTGFCLLMYWLISLARREHTCTPKKSGCDPLPDEYAESIPTDMSMGSAMFWVVAGLLILLLSSRLLLWGAINVAQSFGVPDLIIGLTIVAIGTSLPELAASITSVFKGEDDIAIGNVLGSNMFNLLAVLGLPGLIHPLATPADVLTRDYPIMVVFTLLLFALAYGYNGTRRIGRVAGGVLLTGFFAYLGLLFHANSM